MCGKKTGKISFLFTPANLGRAFIAGKAPKRAQRGKEWHDRSPNERETPTKKGNKKRRWRRASEKHKHFREAKGESKERAKVYENEVARGKIRRRETKTKANRVRRKSVQVVSERERERESDRSAGWWEGDGRSVEGERARRARQAESSRGTTQTQTTHTQRRCSAQSASPKKEGYRWPRSAELEHNSFRARS